MTDSQSDLGLLELVAAAQAEAKTSEDRISEALKSSGSDAQVEELANATAALEATSVDIYSVFEARMQHHFRRGPFSRKLKALLLENRQADLANRLHEYYLAINVLKHGKGASYRELLEAPSGLFEVKPSVKLSDDDADEETSASLVDITGAGFFAGLTATIVEAYHFLKNQ